MSGSLVASTDGLLASARCYFRRCFWRLNQARVWVAFVAEPRKIDGGHCTGGEIDWRELERESERERERERERAACVLFWATSLLLLWPSLAGARPINMVIDARAHAPDEGADAGRGERGGGGGGAAVKWAWRPWG